MPTQQNVKQVWTGSNIIHDFANTILLLTEVAIHLLDKLGLPRLKDRYLLYVVQPFRLLHVLNVEHLIVVVHLFQHQANSDFVSSQIRLTHFWLLE